MNLLLRIERQIIVIALFLENVIYNDILFWLACVSPIYTFLLNISFYVLTFQRDICYHIIVLQDTPIKCFVILDDILSSLSGGHRL